MKILVVDDHPIVRLGLVRLIENGWPDAMIEEADNVAAAKASVTAAMPHIMTLDLHMPDAQGTEALSQMLRVAKGVPILVLSQGREESYAERVMQMGAAGYMNKDRSGTELVHAMRHILQGGRYVSPQLADRLLSMLGGAAGAQLPHALLTVQEYRVMQLIAAGRGPSQIAIDMHLSVKTVANYRSRIMAKTNWKNNIQLTKYCIEHGLTPSD